MMTKLNDIMSGKLRSTDPQEAFSAFDEAEQQIKDLMLETFGKALEAKSVEEMAEIFRKEVEAL